MIHLVTGGSGSGKSEYAEQLAVKSGDFPRIYLATMMVWDREGEQRVLRHRAMRAEKGFVTVERFSDLDQMEAPGVLMTSDDRAVSSVILLECMSNLVSNEFYREREGTAERILKGIRFLAAHCRDLIIVTNEVFSDGVCYGEETEAYLKLLGEINCRLGRLADTVTEVVFGCPVKIK